MALDNQIIETYKRFLECIPVIDKGIKRIRSIGAWPETEVAKRIAIDFDAMCDYMAFVEGTKRPFFEILNQMLLYKTNTLFSNLLKMQDHSNAKLTSDEAFDLFMYLGNQESREIIDSCNNISTSDYTLIINAIEQKDKNAFSSVFLGKDYSRFMSALWQLRYVLLGITQKADTISNTWLNGPDYHCYFSNVKKEHESMFIINKIKNIAKITKKKRTRRTDYDVIPITIDEIKGTGMYKHYTKDILSCFPSMYETQLNNYIDDLVNKKGIIADECDKLASAILVSSLVDRKDIIEKELKSVLGGISTNNKNNNQIIVGRIDAKALLELTEGKNKAKRIQNETLEAVFSEAIERVWENGPREWIYYDIKTFGEYIFIFTLEMKRVLKLVETTLDENEINLLQWILSLSNYNIHYSNINDGDVTKEIVYAENYIEQGLELDVEKGHEKWFIKVLDSKIKGEGYMKTKNLYKNLENLYRKLIELKCIQPDVNRELFIYRFSGIYGANGPFQPDKDARILWEGGTTLLGYIARCLLTDKDHGAEGFNTFSSFFRRSFNTDKDMNLSSARYIEVEKDMIGHSNLPKPLEVALNLLLECGFINVHLMYKKNGDN